MLVGQADQFQRTKKLTVLTCHTTRSTRSVACKEHTLMLFTKAESFSPSDSLAEELSESDFAKKLISELNQIY